MMMVLPKALLLVALVVVADVSAGYEGAYDPAHVTSDDYVESFESQPAYVTAEETYAVLSYPAMTYEAEADAYLVYVEASSSTSGEFYDEYPSTQTYDEMSSANEPSSSELYTQESSPSSDSGSSEDYY